MERLDFKGSTGGLFMNLLIGYFFLIITLGIYFPWFFTKLERWKAEHTFLGEHPFKFEGTGGGLIGKFIMWYLIGVGLVVCYLIGFFTFDGSPAMQGLIILTFPVAISWYYTWAWVQFTEWKVENTVYLNQPPTSFQPKVLVDSGV